MTPLPESFTPNEGRYPRAEGKMWLKIRICESLISVVLQLPDSSLSHPDWPSFSEGPLKNVSTMFSLDPLHYWEAIEESLVLELLFEVFEEDGAEGG